MEIKGGDAELGKDIAMQVAAANPSYLERSQVSKEELEHERKFSVNRPAMKVSRKCC